MPAAIPALVTMAGTMIINAQNKKAMRKATAADREEMAAEKIKFDKKLAEYEESEFISLDEEALKQENIFEDVDMTKDVLKAADYAQEQFQQRQANIMEALRGTAGAAGIAGLATSLSTTAAAETRETGITIGQQLAQGRRMAMQEQSRLNAQERAIRIANMEGARQFEMDKMSTLIGVSGKKIKGAREYISGTEKAYMGRAGAQSQALGSALSNVNFGS